MIVRNSAVVSNGTKTALDVGDRHFLALKSPPRAAHD